MGSSNSKFTPEANLPDLHGKVAIVTGANTGIGLYTVLHLARRGAKVYLGARNRSRAEDAIARLNEGEGLAMCKGAGEVVWLNLNLSDPRDAAKSAKWFLDHEDRLDILINNAGKIISPYGLTEDGISDSVVINHISPFIFTHTLLPLLEKTSASGADVRIVSLSSMAHRWVNKPRFNSLEAFNNDFSSERFPKTSVYGYTKLANVLYIRELQRRLDQKGSNIIALSVHPGSVLSDESLCLGNINLFSSLFCGPLLVWLASLHFVMPYEGAFPSVFAAASEDVRNWKDHFKGQYIVPGNKVEETSKDGQDMRLAKELRETTESLLKGMSLLPTE